MTETKIMIKEYGDWCYCHNQPGVLRRIVDFKDDGTPIIEEKSIKEVNKELAVEEEDRILSSDKNM